jgi:uracil-DNA glycosylase
MVKSSGISEKALKILLKDVRACTLCAKDLPLGPRPILQVGASARILIAGQAPGVKVHESGVPFADASGDRLRDWMGIDKEVFYNPAVIAILPMGFCYSGTCSSGDLPPRRECAPEWRERLLAAMPHIELTLVIGQYAQAWHMPETSKLNLTGCVQAWRDVWPKMLPLPHPSPRNNIWLKKNPWFVSDVIPNLRKKVKHIIQQQ